jgi:RNA-directed DNA polymerase
MSLATPEKIRILQRKLYRKAKAEPAFRFYLLYDKIYREDIFRHAYALARANAGAPGTDGMTFAAIEALGLESWLAGLREELILKTYRPDPVRRVMIPKPDGGERPLGIPTIRDRVVQTAAKLVLEPIFEADFEDSAYGYRPARGAVDAVKESMFGGEMNGYSIRWYYSSFAYCEPGLDCFLDPRQLGYFLRNFIRQRRSRGHCSHRSRANGRDLIAT